MPYQGLASKRRSDSQFHDKIQRTPARTGRSSLLSTAARQTKARVYQGLDTVLHRKGVGLQRQSVVLYLKSVLLRKNV